MDGEGPKLRNLSIGIKYKGNKTQQQKKIVITIITSGIDNSVNRHTGETESRQNLIKCNVPLVVIADWAASNIAV